MVLREDLVASAVTFLQDPSVSASPIENRIAFLQSKNLTQEEIDVALARTGGGSAPAANYSHYGSPQQTMAQPSTAYGGYQQYPWQQPPPELRRRDWRDWFIMATVMGGVSYGLYTVAKRYVLPLIAPPTPPQLEQDKREIDESFEKAFALLDQLAKDTEALKASEQSRTERLDAALSEVESVIGELKTSGRRREEDSQRIGDEVRGLKDLIPKAMEGQKEATDTRLKELNTELKSLKMLMGQRMIPPGTPATINSAFNRIPDSKSVAPAPLPPNANTTASSDSTNESKPPSVINGVSAEAVASLQAQAPGPNRSSFSPVVPSGRASIPAWQMAAVSKSSKTSDESGAGGSKEGGGSA